MYQSENYSTQYQIDTRLALNAYLVKVFGTMFAGLAITAIVAFYFAASNLVYTLGNAVFVIMIAQLVLVLALTASINKLSYRVALGLFMLYSLLNGITMAFIFVVYDIGTIGTAFTVTALTFGIMAVYGSLTKSDLTAFGSLARMLLIGGLIVMLINMFMGSPAIDYFISVVLLFVFVGLVAYDTQKLKGFFYATQNDIPTQQKVGVIGALSLYLDFINIFLRLLRIFGRSKR
ncbi:MAG: Bax inhibitor-1/YccA family protein [Clostridiaceae bacterium]|jgi:FtsH-binding integral membrane protein|nr:Bax inhibitor-1/YccA family protein [Clostridiaceae bacterium]